MKNQFVHKAICFYACIGHFLCVTHPFPLRPNSQASEHKNEQQHIFQPITVIHFTCPTYLCSNSFALLCVVLRGQRIALVMPNTRERERKRAETDCSAWFIRKIVCWSTRPFVHPSIQYYYYCSTLLFLSSFFFPKLHNTRNWDWFEQLCCVAATCESRSAKLARIAGRTYSTMSNWPPATQKIAHTHTRTGGH